MKNLKGNNKWCFSRLKCDKKGAADAVNNLTSKNRRNNVLRRKEKNKEGTAYDKNMFRSKK